MRQLKYKYYFENIKYGGFYTNLYTLEEIENGDLADFIDGIEGVEYEVRYKCQFTGLLDKQGVEIYEGDIIRAFDLLLEVKWVVDYWYAETMDSKLGECGQEWQGICEVLGNIYENPELLQDKA